MMFNKNAQVSLFIIMGIVIVAIIALLFYAARESAYLSKHLPVEQLRMNDLAETLSGEIGSCLDSILEESVYVSAIHGGYTSPPLDFFDFEGTAVPYYALNGKNMILSEEQLRYELEFYIINHLPECINVDYYTSQKVSLSGGVVNPTVTLMDDYVKVVVDYPVKLSREGAEYTLDRPYNARTSTRLRFLRQVSEDISKKFLEGRSLLDFEYTLSTGLNITTFAYPDNTLLYTLFDTSFEKQIGYNFALKKE